MSLWPLDALHIPGSLPAIIAWAIAILLSIVVGIPAARYAMTRPTTIVEFPMSVGERQLWIGTPVRGVPLWISVASTLVPAAFAIALFSAFLRLFEAWNNLLVFVPFVALGAAASLARTFDAARRRKLTTYAVTTTRAIVSVGDRVDSYPVDELRNAELVERKRGAYDIEWGPANARHSFATVDGAFEAYDRIREVVGPPVAARSEPSIGPPGTGPSAPTRPLRLTEKLIGVGFFAVFAAFGIGFGYFAGWPALRDTVDARSWVAVPCEIVSSGVKTTTDSDGSNYSVDVKFRYEYAGQRYSSDRYQITRMSQSGAGAYDRISRKAQALPAGLSTTCFLDPARPDRAVIDRGLTLGTLLFVGLPALFALVGLGGMVAVASARFTRAPRLDRSLAVEP